MTTDRLRLADYLQHVLQAIERINNYIGASDQASFFRNNMVQDAVIRNLEIIGEACRNIERRYPEFAATHPELPLSSAYQMRNAVVHGYFWVDLEIVWRTIQNDLEPLREIVGSLVETSGKAEK